MVTVTKDRRDFINPRRFGAVADAVYTAKASGTAGSMTLTDTVTTPFTPTMVGKPIVIVGAGTAGAPLVTTVSGYTSSSNITLGNSIVTAVTDAEAIVGTDDTVAIAKAIAYATKRGKAVMLDGCYISGPQALPPNCTIVGNNGATVYLKPGSATTSKYLFSASSISPAACHNITIDSLTLNGLREFQRNSGTNAVLEDITLLVYDNGAASANPAPNNPRLRGTRFTNLVLLNAGRAGIYHKSATDGDSVISDITITNCGYGMEILSSRNLFSNIFIRGMGIGIAVQGLFANHNVFTNVIITECGWKTLVDGIAAPAGNASLYIVTGRNNTFNNLTISNSWGSGVFIQSGNSNIFNNLTLNDIGAAYAVSGLGPDNTAAIRAAITFGSNTAKYNYLDGRIINNQVTSYITHGVHVVAGTTTNGEGRLVTYPGFNGFVTAKYSSNNNLNKIQVGEPQDDLWYINKGSR